MKLVSVVIVNYHSDTFVHNYEDLLRRELEIELIVVDNSGDFCSQSPDTIRLAPGQNIGFGRACNLGARRSESEILLFLNPDTSFSRQDIVKMSMLCRDMKNGLVGPKLIDKNGSASILVSPGDFGLSFKRLEVDCAMPKGQHLLDVTYVSGACMFIQRRCFEELGGFRNDIFLYGEDLDLCLRAKDWGARVCVDTSMECLHFGGRADMRKRRPLLRLLRSVRGHYRVMRTFRPALPAFLDALYLASGVRRKKIVM